MPAKVYSAATLGLDGQPIEVEVDLAVGLHCFNIVGLPDAAINESRERVTAAIKNSGLMPPSHSRRRVIVNLAPADLKKEGPAYDLPIATAYLIVSNQIKISPNDLKSKIFVGELSLEGKLRPINGIISITMMAASRGFKTIFVPTVNAAEAALINNIEVIPLDNLLDLISHLEGKRLIAAQPSTDLNQLGDSLESSSYDMAYIRGQEHAKRALEIAAAGGHNVLMTGSPGTGKTLLAKTLPSIMPSLAKEEILEATQIYSVAGLLSKEQGLIKRRPFRNPHHTSSAIALVGGGSHPRPGEITLAHRGVLFLDEFPEFPRQVLEALRQPLEDGMITVSRVAGTINFPAKFILIAAMNPCPCGKKGDPELSCLCAAGQIIKYQRKISEPLLDRIDLHLEVPRIKYDKLLAQEKVAEESVKIRERVQQARLIQQQRFAGQSIFTNSEMGLAQLKEFCQLDTITEKVLRDAADKLHLSPRSFHRLLKLSRTIADLADTEKIATPHLAEALQYRPKRTF